MKTKRPKAKRAYKPKHLSNTEESKPAALSSWDVRPAMRRVILSSMEELVNTNKYEAILASMDLLSFGAATLVRLNEGENPPNRGDGANLVERCICNHAAQMMEMICILTKSGRYLPVRCAWDGATAIAETIHDLALAGPLDQISRIARDSMTMPSLRAKPKNFTFDFKKIAEKIELSVDCGVNIGRDVKYKFDAVPTRIVASLIDRIDYLRHLTSAMEKRLGKIKELAAKSETLDASKWFLNISLKDYLQEQHSNEMASAMCLYHSLPPFSKTTAKRWWDEAIKPWLEKPECLEQIRGTPFYSQLEKAAHQSKTTTKTYGVLDELKKRCYQVVLKSGSLLTPPVKS